LRDVCGRQHSQRDLVQERLEGVMIPAIDQNDVDGEFGEAERCVQTGEAASDNHNARRAVFWSFECCNGHAREPRLVLKIVASSTSNDAARRYFGS
jgi:hypothetical protein